MPFERYNIVDPSCQFVTMSEEDLKDNWKRWYPGGSGPLAAMRVVCALIETVARLRGFDVMKWTEKE